MRTTENGLKVTCPPFLHTFLHIHWEFTELDRKTYETNCKLFNESSDRYSSIIRWTPWNEIGNNWSVNGHHIGTTRMSASSEPTQGVVDENLKIHGIDNLYVAGASVFPTAGVSNPTLTIVALSIRLAEHLTTRLVRPG